MNSQYQKLTIKTSGMVILLTLSISLVSFAKTSTHTKSSNSAAQTPSSPSKRGSELSDKDKIFMDLREASRKNDLLKSIQLANQLSDYEIADYVE